MSMPRTMAAGTITASQRFARAAGTSWTTTRKVGSQTISPPMANIENARPKTE